MDFLKELNDVQRAAVTTIDGPVLIVAGPGSGKTRVLTYRIAHLLNSNVPPYAILALTFTNKAAKEMQERIERVVGDRAHGIFAGTFHSIFSRILRIEAERIGYTKNFTIYDSDDTKSLLQNIITDQKLDPKLYSVGDVRARISQAKSSLYLPEDYATNSEIQEQDREGKRPLIGKLYNIYYNRCRRADAMDFDDLLLQFYILLRDHPDITEKYRRKFRFIMVDEFQDTNSLQYEIVRRLVVYPQSPTNICVVGDDAQSIYAFRGATIQNILDFRSDFPQANVYKLEQNYRSTEPIVAAANAVIEHNSRQIQKKIWTERGTGLPIQLVKAVSDNEEGQRVADGVIEQKNRYHLRNSEIAILYRTNSQSRIFEESMRRFNIPYRVYGGLSFYQRKEVKDVLGYLRLIINPSDEEALRRIINYPTRKIGGTTVSRILAFADAGEMSPWAVVENAHNFPELKSALTALKNFKLLIENFRKRAATESAYQVAVAVVKQSGILAELKADSSPEGINRLENVNALLDGIHTFSEAATQATRPDDLTTANPDLVSDGSLATYLQTISLLTDADNDTGNDTERVTLMSVHAAKGLEFRSVFVVGLEENLFPSFQATQTPAGMDEERRLFYVAITRAQEYLTLTYAGTRYRFGQMRSDTASRFIGEIPPILFDRSAARAVPASQQNNPRSTVSGLRVGAKPQTVSVDISNFSPSPIKDIVPAATVLHQRFGKGEVEALDGTGDARVAIIYFTQLKEQKRIMLKFAKLQVL